MSDTNSSLGNKITGYIPVLTLVSLIFGVVSLVLYYSYFRVDILSYLELNEIIFRTARDLIFIFAGVLLAFVLTGSQNENDTSSEKKKFNYSKKGFIQVVKSDSVLFSMFIFWFVVLWVLIILRQKDALEIKYFSVGVCQVLMIIGIIFVPVELKRRYMKKYGAFPSNEIILFSRFLVIVFFCGLIRGDIEITRTIESRGKLSNSIIANGQLIKSTKDYYYIGKTNGYVFFYDERSQKADVYPISVVSKLSIKE